MHKRILAICAALVALVALSIPAAASASVTLREAGTTVPVGTKILASGDEHSIFSGGQLVVTCNENSLTGTVVKNNGTTVETTIETASFKGTEADTRCNGGSLMGNTRVIIPALTNEGGTGHWCLKNITGEDKFQVIGANCGTPSGTLTFTLEGAIVCTYTTTAAVTGTFNTTTNATLTVTPNGTTFSKEAVSNVLCPATGAITEMKFTLSTDPGAALQLDDVS